MSEQAVNEGRLQIKDHDWRQWTMTSVTPIGTLSDGSPALVQCGEGDTKVFCFACSLGMTDENKHTPCPGEDEDQVD